MSIKLNNITAIDAVKLDDGSGSVKDIYGIQVNDGSATTKVWGKLRPLVLSISLHIDINSVNVYRLENGFEPSAQLGLVTPTSRDPVSKTVNYDNLYYGDIVLIEAIPDAGYMTSGTGEFTVYGGSSQIEKPLSTSATDIHISGSLTSQALVATETLSIENNRSSAVTMTSLIGTKVINGSITGTIQPGNTGTLRDTKTLTSLPTGNYTVTVSFTDGTYASGTISNQT